MGIPTTRFGRTVFAWCATAGAAVEHGAEVVVSCSRCKLWRPADLNAIIKACGPDYSLYDRHFRCKVPGCRGWVQFHASPGKGTPIRPLRTMLNGLHPLDWYEGPEAPG